MRKSESDPVRSAGPQWPVAGRVELGELGVESVTFAYDRQDEPSLTGIDLIAPERRLTALVGSSGSGKTTVTKLISRLADPQEGVVRIGGVELSTLEPDEVLRHIAVVFQDVYLFDDSIRANIALARPDATDAEIEAAARAANVHEFVDRFPDRYETQSARSGPVCGAASASGPASPAPSSRTRRSSSSTSRPPPWTPSPGSSSSTPSTNLVAGKTVVIAHRLSTVVGADQILVVDRGRIIQRGTHGDLLAEIDGRYARMWSAQGGGASEARARDLTVRYK